jgi:hypothetical protein
MARDGLMGDTYLTVDGSEQLERGAGRQDGFVAFRLRLGYCGQFVTSQSHAKTILRAKILSYSSISLAVSELRPFLLARHRRLNAVT